MIITRYLVKETFKNQLYILFTLLFIFFCQKLIRILDAAIEGHIPTNLILSLLSLGLPEMAQLILPLSLFLALLITFSRMYTESEITVMHACGLGKSILIRATLILSLFTIIIAILNVAWLSPWSIRYQNLVMLEAKTNPNITTLVNGQFKLVENGNSVLFISNIKNKKFENVFLAQLKPQNHIHSSVLIAHYGHIKEWDNGSQIIMLNNGARYEGTALLHNFCITYFAKYQAILDHQRITTNGTDSEQMTFNELLHLHTPETRTELHWRFTLIMSVFIMAIIAIPLSVVNQRQGRVWNMLVPIVIYLVFFLLQTSLRAHGAKGTINPMIWMWITNLMYLGLALVLNLWDSVFIRKLRWRLHAKGVV